MCNVYDVYGYGGYGRRFAAESAKALVDPTASECQRVELVAAADFAHHLPSDFLVQARIVRIAQQFAGGGG